MLNFTVGPVMIDEAVSALGAEQVPYFRNEEFSQLMFENEAMMKELAGCEDDGRVVFITGSGTAAMEASIVNGFTEHDRVLVVNGGSFGARFAELLRIHKIPYTEIKLSLGQNVTPEMLAAYDGQGYTGFVINMCETSTGLCYDMDAVTVFALKNNLFLIVDCVSAFLAEPINMQEMHIDMLLTGSQKALACPPGVSVVVLSKRAVERVQGIDCGCMYLDLKGALKDGERGQTMFTPAVGILRQIHLRLKRICDEGGAAAENLRIADLASDFRRKMLEAHLPFSYVTQSMSYSVTALVAEHENAYDIYLHMKDEYGIWICPNGGALKDKVFRVGHIGALTKSDNDTLISAFLDMRERGLL